MVIANKNIPFKIETKVIYKDRHGLKIENMYTLLVLSNNARNNNENVVKQLVHKMAFVSQSMYINLNIFSKNLFTFKIKNINIFYN
jgi:hypothetical protein